MEMQSSVIQDGFHVKIKSKKNTNSVEDNLETQVGFNRPNKNERKYLNSDCFAGNENAWEKSMS